MNDTLAGYNVQETYSSARQIAEQVDMVHLLQALGFMVSPRTRRCACLLHGGNNRSAFSWTDNLWYCHVCHAGGDRIHLVRAVRDCSFHEAVGFLAALAGVDACGLDDARWESRQFATPESEERAACLLAATEHAKLLELSYELNQLRQLGEKARQWLAEQKRPRTLLVSTQVCSGYTPKNRRRVLHCCV